MTSSPHLEMFKKLELIYIDLAMYIISISAQNYLQSIQYYEINRFILFLNKTWAQETLEMQYVYFGSECWILSTLYEPYGVIYKLRLPCNIFLPQITQFYRGQFARWRKWRACDVGEVKEELENELWRRLWWIWGGLRNVVPVLWQANHLGYIYQGCRVLD